MDDELKEERTITVPKKYLKGIKEGQVESFKVILDADESFVLLPELPSEDTTEDEIKEVLAERKGEKKESKNFSKH